MEREKMLDLWKKEFENSWYQWNLSPKVYEYFDGKTELNFDPVSGGRKYYSYYNEWMIKELDGENAELARRMLVIVSKIRNGGLITGSYRAKQDVELLLRIGYDFDSVVDKSVLKMKDITPKDTYAIAKLLIEYLPGDSEKFADSLLDPKILEDLISKRKSNRGLYLGLCFATVFLHKDAEKYKRYLPLLESVYEQAGGEYMIAMLYYAYTLSGTLKDHLLKLISTQTATAPVIMILAGSKEMLGFLESIGAPRWPYYFLVLNRGIDNANIPEVIKKLYIDDKETFMQLYEKLSQAKSSQEYIDLPYLLAVLLNNGEGEAQQEGINLPLLGIFKRLLSEYMDKAPSELSDLADENIPVKDVINKIHFTRGFGWGSALTAIGAISVLYDYSPRARRFIHLLLKKTPKSSSNYNNRSYAAAYFINSRKKWLGISPVQSIETLLKSDADFSVSDVFALYCFAYISYGQLQDNISMAVTPQFIDENKDAALELLIGGQLSIEETQIWADLLYAESGFDNYEPLISMLGNKSKLIRKKAEELLNDKEEKVRPMLEEKMPKMKGDALAATKRMIKRWDNERKFGADFTFSDNNTVIEFCTDNYDTDNSKFISWIPEDMLSDVRFADLSEKAPDVVMKYILSEYLALEEPYKIKVCDKVVEQLNPVDFQSSMENIYRFWLDSGAEAKKKMFMVPYCIYASDSQILRLRTQLKDWADASRGAVAAFVVNAIAMNGGSVALMMIDGISVKFPNNQVKNAAKEAFVFAAKALEIPEDELSDKIVPTLGFNTAGEKVLDYGGRTFKITLMPDFSLTIFDNDKQKIIKSMPAPGANDDTVKASAAKKEFSELKKQMKATVQSQTNRLEKVIMNGRRWSVEAWNKLFVENPIMHRFATGLIWGTYNNDVLEDTFRYMEDGTFNTADEDEYSLPENAAITLVHPCEMDADTLLGWKEQLDDYEIIQPIPQLSAPVVELKENEIDGKKIMRYNGSLVPSGKIAAIAKKYNMVRGDIGDGGSYTCFHWVDKYLNIAAQLNFEYMYMGQEFNEEVPLYDVLFYRLGEDGSVNDEPKSNAILNPANIPQRFVSSVLGVFDQLIEKK